MVWTSTWRIWGTRPKRLRQSSQRGKDISRKDALDQEPHTILCEGLENIISKKVRIVLYADDGDNVNVNQLMYWLLYDPLLISEVSIEVDVRKTECTGAVSYPDLSESTLSNCDLVIISQGDLQRLKQEYFQPLMSYLESGGALLAVQLMSESEKMPNDLEEEIGAKFVGWIPETPFYSVKTDHHSNRIVSLSEAETVYPHRDFWGHMKFDLEDAFAMTRLGFGGDPDLFVSGNSKVAIFATDAFDDLLHYMHHPEYGRYEENLFYLTINVIRHLLGLGFITDPISRDLRRWGSFFRAYAMGRQFVLSTYEELKEKVAREEIIQGLDEADQNLSAASRRAVEGDSDGTWNKYREAVECLSKCMDKMTSVRRFITRGWHGGNLFDDYRSGGGLLGYAEFCWADWSVQWMKKQLEWMSLTGGRRLTEVCGQTLEVLAKYYSEDIKLFKSAIEKGDLEPVGGLYSYAYLLNLGTESNIRQFSYGLKATKNALGVDVETYHVAGDHYAFHPQLPQILNSFGYKYAVLRSGSPGWIKGVHAEKIYWRGLDGSRIEALPTYSDISEERPERWWNPKRIADAEKAGYKTIFLGSAIDATMTLPFAEKEHTIINSIAPVAGKMATFKEYFERTPKPVQECYFDVDDLYGKPDFWAGFGTTNIFHRLYRIAETRLLAAERFEAIAHLLGGPSLVNDLREAWKGVLIAQDHFLGGGCGPWEGQHTGSFYLGRIPNYSGPKMLPGVDEKTKRLFEDGYKAGSKVLGKAIDYIVAKINTKVQEEETYVPLIVFNPLGWEREGATTVKVDLPKGKGSSILLFDGKRQIRYQVISEERYPDGSLKMSEIAFVAKVPPVGYKTYFLKCETGIESSTLSANNRTMNDSAPTMLENRHYLVELDPQNGCIKRIFDKELGLDIVDETIGLANEVILPAKISSRTGKASIGLIEDGPIRLVTSVKGDLNGLPYTCLISLCDEPKRIDFDLQIDYGEGASFGINREEETNLRVVFPLKMSIDAKLYVNQPFGLYETKMPKNHKIQVCSDFADLRDGDYGVLLAHESTPGYCYDGKSLCIILADGYPPVNGLQRYRYSIYTHKAGSNNGDLLKVAEEFNNPLIAVQASIHEGDLQQETSFFSVNKTNIILSAVFREADTICVRLYDIDGVETTARLKTFKHFSQAIRIKLNNEAIETLRSVDGVTPLRINPWQISTIALKEA